MKMISFLQSWLSTKAQADGERGAGLAEYALLLVLVAIACITTLGVLGTTISGVYTTITGGLTPGG